MVATRARTGKQSLTGTGVVQFQLVDAREKAGLLLVIPIFETICMRSFLIFRTLWGPNETHGFAGSSSCQPGFGKR